MGKRCSDKSRVASDWQKEYRVLNFKELLKGLEAADWILILEQRRLALSIACFRPPLMAQRVKNLPAMRGDAGDLGLIPGFGRSLGGGNGNPLHCFRQKKSQGQRRNLVSYRPKGRKLFKMTVYTRDPCFCVISSSTRKCSNDTWNKGSLTSEINSCGLKPGSQHPNELCVLVHGVMPWKKCNKFFNEVKFPSTLPVSLYIFIVWKWIFLPISFCAT